MKIGVVGPIFPDSLADNMLSALRSLGYEAAALGSTLPDVHPRVLKSAATIAVRSGSVARRFQRSIVAAAAAIGVDATINVEVGLHPDVVAGLRTVGPVALWFPDALTNLDRQYPFIAPYSALFLKDPWLVRRVNSFLPVPTYYLPEACNPRWHRPPLDPVWNPEIVMAGNVYPFRSVILDRLIADGVPVRIYGPPPPPWCSSPAVRAAHTGRYIARHEKADVFGNAAGVLNTLHPGEIESINCRMFEAAACGALVITERRSALGELFVEGEHFLGFGDYTELRQVVATVLESGAELRRRIGGAAASHALTSHTYEARLSDLLDQLLP